MAEESQKFGAMGGKARAANLTKEELSTAGKRAAAVRWGKPFTEVNTTPKALYGSPDKPLRIASVEIPCYVLDDGRRVLAQRGLKSAIGMSASGGTSGAQRVARFVESLAAKGIDTKDLAVRINNPILFQTPAGGKVTYGYEAEMLPDLCDVIWEAAQQHLLQKQQRHIGIQAQAVTRALAKTGIIALVDEATGYQEVRPRDELSEILQRFISKELRPWVRRFPFQFYEKIFELKGWDTSELTPNSPKPREVGRITDDLIYKRLAPFVRSELRRLVPRDEKGRLVTKLHRHLTDDIGHPKLEKHIAVTLALMNVSPTWAAFMDNMDKVLPPFGKNYELPLNDEHAAPKQNDQNAG